MEKTKTAEQIIEDIKYLPIEDKILIYRTVSDLIAKEEKEAEEKLNLIRGKKN